MDARGAQRRDRSRARASSYRPARRLPPSLERVARGDLLEPLERARHAGKIRAFGYSGDGDALAWAAQCDAIDVVECSVNVVDREALSLSVPSAVARGAIVLAKRAFASGAFLPDQGRDGPGGVYSTRFRALVASPPALEIGDRSSWEEVALRFAAHAPGVSSALVGTRSAAHLATAVKSAALGPLPESMSRVLDTRWGAVGAHWTGVV